MFFATEFCIVRFSIGQFQFIDQPYVFLGPNLPIKSPVNDVFVVNDTIWAATKNGIAYANINSSLPIQTSWTNFVTNSSPLRRNLTNCISYFASRVLIGSDSGMVSYHNGVLANYEPLYNGSPLIEPVYRMSVSNGNLYFSTYTNYGEFRGNFRIFKVNQGSINNAELVMSGTEVNSLDVNQGGDLLIGTVNHGVDVYRNNSSNFVSPNGPGSNVFQDVVVDNAGNVWAVSGGLNAGVYRYDHTSWKNYNTEQYPWMLGNDFRHIYASKYSQTIWAGAFGTGLLKINGDSLFAYNNQNSCLIPLDGNFTLVEGLGEDNGGNLWVINRASPTPIVKFSPDPCVSFQVPTNPSQNTLIFMAVDNYNTKWMSYPSDLPGQVRGVAYFNENTVPTGLIIGAGSLGADISTVNHVTVDKNGEVWIGTDNGIAIIRDPSQVINNPGTIPFREKMRIIENGISTPLTENVQFVGVDALNNKWIGTLSNGLLYVSPDGSTLLARYNTDNSPLPSNRILSIVVSPITGVAYFGTEKGLAAFNTIAVQPLAECDKISVGPNPFIVPASTKLKIDGLVAESTVKILTISGALVAEFETPGGRIAEWDGKDLYGNYVSSGIYIIAGFNEDASQVCTGKVAVVRR
jgi:ligand-binding sensor domain-containing protein